MELTSQKMRRLAPELDPLRLGTGWTPDELSKPQIIVESTFGDSHPGSGHLDKLVNAACKGAAEAGGPRRPVLCHRHLRRRESGYRRHQLQPRQPRMMHASQ